MKRRYDWKRDKRDHRDRIYSAVKAMGLRQVLQDKVDLSPGFLSIENQGNLGSCTSHALAAAVEYLEGKLGNTQSTFAGERVSRLFIYYNERMLEGTVDEDSGAQIRDGVKSLNQYGVCNESSWLYDPDQAFTHPPPNCYEEAAKRKIARYLRVVSITDIKLSLSQGFPVTLGFEVFESFESEDVAKTGIVPMPGPDEQNLGGHAVIIVGYDNATGMFKVRNSWGEAWGDKGYFYLSYDFVNNPNLCDDTWVIQK